jgi:hypothetical protein
MDWGCTWMLWTNSMVQSSLNTLRECIQKFLDWLPGARTANGTVLCHYVQLYHYFVSRSSEFCCHNPLYCFQWVFIVVCILLLTQSRNFGIHPHKITQFVKFIAFVEPEGLSVCSLCSLLDPLMNQLNPVHCYTFLIPIWGRGGGLDLSGLGLGPVVGSCENSYEPLESIKVGEFLD